MSEVSPVLGLPYIQPAQAQKHVTHNEALALIDVLVQLAVEDHVNAMPPAAPAVGERHIIGAGATGLWAGFDLHIAVWDGTLWNFRMPGIGWEAYSIASDLRVRFDGIDWVPVTGAMELAQLGVNTAADLINRLAVASDATLFTHDGAGHQMKLNKQTAGDTASLLYQTDFSGRAEMGTAGNDDFSIKVSPDGASWTTAMAFNATSGLATGAAVQTGPADVTPGRLARADYAYGRGNVLGTVSQSGGVPTGAVLERGSNANGRYVRFADGTQICWSPAMMVDVDVVSGAIFRSAVLPWVFPAAFSVSPALTQGRQNFSAGYWTVPGFSNATSGRVSAMSYQSITGCETNLVAFGRWF